MAYPRVFAQMQDMIYKCYRDLALLRQVQALESLTEFRLIFDWVHFYLLPESVVCNMISDRFGQAQQWNVHVVFFEPVFEVDAAI